MIMLAANFFWHGLPVDVLVAAGEGPRKKALDWLMKFSSEKKRLLIYQVKEDWFAFGSAGLSGRDFRSASPAARSHGRTDPLAPSQLRSAASAVPYAEIHHKFDKIA